MHSIPAFEEVLDRARRELKAIDFDREVFRLVGGGLHLHAVAKELGIKYTIVVRILNLANVFVVDPAEMIMRAAVEGTDRAALINALCRIEFSFGVDDPAFEWGPSVGTWHQVVRACGDGLITDDEFDAVRSAVNPPPANLDWVMPRI